MKKILGLLLLVPTLVSAQEIKPEDQKMFWARQYCGPMNEVFKTPEKYKEGMLFAGDGVNFEARSGMMYQSGMFFFVNQDTGSWTMINVYNDGVACVVQTGKRFAPYTGSQPWENQESGEKG